MDNNQAEFLELLGPNFEKLTEKQLEVLASLSEAELKTLRAINERLTEIDEVKGYDFGGINSGILFY